MRQLRMLFLGTVLLLIGVCLFGCSSKSEDESNKGTIGTTAPIDNNAPQAKGAPAAPTDPSIEYPGMKKGKKN